jgi:PhzF family phenazine biosynthesis protein
MRLRTVDAFAERPFAGSPAAVVVLDETPPDKWMAALARETSLPDTGFVIREEVPDADFGLRWFTPTVEVDLCGHATLASAHCLFEDGVAGPIRFATRSGVLTVDRRSDGTLAMDFPVWASSEFEPARAAVAAALRRSSDHHRACGDRLRRHAQQRGRTERAVSAQFRLRPAGLAATLPS